MSSNFSSLGVRADLVACLSELGINEPYPIQSSTLPDALAGHDLFAQSPTGSGKTLAYAIPMISRIGKARPGHPRGLILAPTRELAAQISDAMKPLARVAGRRVASFYGGTGYKEQINALRHGVDIVVGCPGRLIDLLERNVVNFSEVEIAVIDEADRMADMGFLPDVRRLLDDIQGSRQTMLFSATLTRDVERLVRDYQHGTPKRHVLEQAKDDIGSRTHEFWRSGREERTKLTVRLVASHDSSIVFCRTKRGVDRLTKQLEQSGVAAVAIHGDRSQAQRDRALAQFRERRAQVLVGTDVASRGIHVDGVDCVVHFDPPEDHDTYVHRSGRTGRAGASGRVVSLISSDQERTAKRLASSLGLDARLASPPEMAEVVVRARPVSNLRDERRAPRPHAGGSHSRGPSSSSSGAPYGKNRKRRKPVGAGESNGQARSQSSGTRSGPPRTHSGPPRSRARRAS